MEVPVSSFIRSLILQQHILHSHLHLHSLYFSRTSTPAHFKALLRTSYQLYISYRSLLNTDISHIPATYLSPSRSY